MANFTSFCSGIYFFISINFNSEESVEQDTSAGLVLNILSGLVIE